MNLNEKDYNRLVSYSYILCKDHSRKKDFVHEAWIRLATQAYNVPKDRDQLLLLLMLFIKQAFFSWLKRWDKKNILYSGLLNAYSNTKVDNMDFPPMETPSKTALEAIRTRISAQRYKYLKNEDKRFRQLITSLKLKDYEEESIERRGNIAEPVMGNR